MSARWEDVEVGDKVTVEITCKVLGLGPDHVALSQDQDGYPAPRTVAKDYTTLKSIEKPVVTFKPGDVVREHTPMCATAYIFTLGEGRYFSHASRRWHTSDLEFTSRVFELVE